MARRLPVKPPSPSIDATRKRLGGRGATEPGAGDIVRVTTHGGRETDAVVLFVQGEELDVWIGDDAVLRTKRSRAKPGPAEPSRVLADVAADARLFAALREGQRVRYHLGDGAYAEGRLLEKCRFGALLLRDDGAIVGVGFRRIWPLMTSFEQN